MKVVDLLDRNLEALNEVPALKNIHSKVEVLDQERSLVILLILWHFKLVELLPMIGMIAQLGHIFFHITNEIKAAMTLVFLPFDSEVTTNAKLVGMVSLTNFF